MKDSNNYQRLNLNSLLTLIAMINQMTTKRIFKAPDMKYSKEGIGDWHRRAPKAIDDYDIIC
jgi:hypothetical protein